MEKRSVGDVPAFQVKAILFDAGNTLLYPHPSVGSVYSRTAKKYGRHVTASRIDTAFYRIWKKKGGLAVLGKHATPAMEKAWWRDRVMEVFASFGGVEPFEPFFEELFELFGSHKTWRLYPGVRQTLRQLRERGYRLGIVSNWDMRLFRICQGLGLERSMDVIIASCGVGVSKPEKGIFQAALKALKLRPEQALHVGDLLIEDYHGARNAGLHALWLSHGHRPPKDVVAIKNLSHLFSFLPRQGRLLPHRPAARSSRRTAR